MTPQTDSSVFFDAWQACLRAHYIYVLRADDPVTEPTLRHVLLQSGLREHDLDALREDALALGPLTPEELESMAGTAAEDEPVDALPEDASGNDEFEGGDDYDLAEDDNLQMSLF